GEYAGGQATCSVLRVEATLSLAEKGELSPALLIGDCRPLVRTPLMLAFPPNSQAAFPSTPFRLQFRSSEDGDSAVE
ncbi:hypothetical protein CRG98_041553, partial [Punica granatum]